MIGKINYLYHKITEFISLFIIAFKHMCFCLNQTMKVIDFVKKRCAAKESNSYLNKICYDKSV